MEDPRIISALFIFLKMAYYNVLINTIFFHFFLGDSQNPQIPAITMAQTITISFPILLQFFISSFDIQFQSIFPFPILYKLIT